MRYSLTIFWKSLLFEYFEISDTRTIGKVRNMAQEPLFFFVFKRSRISYIFFSTLIFSIMENFNILLLHMHDSGLYLYFIWVYKRFRFIYLGGGVLFAKFFIAYSNLYLILIYKADWLVNYIKSLMPRLKNSDIKCNIIVIRIYSRIIFLSQLVGITICEVVHVAELCYINVN